MSSLFTSENIWCHTSCVNALARVRSLQGKYVDATHSWAFNSGGGSISPLLKADAIIHLKATWNLLENYQNKDDHQKDAQATARTIAPIA
jgi:hypothetical protein